MAQTLLIRLDGCVRARRRDGPLYGKVAPGFWDWAEKAAGKGFNIAIRSARANTPSGKFDVVHWLCQDALASQHFDEAAVVTDPDTDAVTLWLKRRAEKVVEVRVLAQELTPFLTIDDRAVPFGGDWTATELDPDWLVTKALPTQ